MAAGYTKREIPYKDRKVDILVKVTVYSGIRKAKVEAIALSDANVQFVTGINYFQGLHTVWADNYLLTWGEHPSPAATKIVAVGSAITFNSGDFITRTDDGQQKLLISKSTKKLEYWISSANAREAELNTFERFKNYVEYGLPKRLQSKTV